MCGEVQVKICKNSKKCRNSRKDFRRRRITGIKDCDIAMIQSACPFTYIPVLLVVSADG